MMDVVEMKDDDRYVYFDEATGELVIRESSPEKIPPCSVPRTLPIMSQAQREQILDRVVYIDDTSPFIREMMQAQEWEAVASDSDWGNNSNDIKLEYESISERSSVVLEPVVKEELACESVSSEDEFLPPLNTEPPAAKSYSLDDPRNSPCPAFTCNFVGRKLKFHVQHSHLPRVMWDNPQPPVRDDKVRDWDRIRGEILLYLAECITGCRSVWELVNWVNGMPHSKIPRRSQILGKARNQMTRLCDLYQWEVPNTFVLRPVISPCILIHWRYQVVFSYYLQPNQLRDYLQMGTDFMTNIDNLKESPYAYAQTYSLLARVLAIRASETVIDPDSEITDVQVVRSPRRVVLCEESSVPCNLIDSHCHLDRSSKKLLGTGLLTMERWTSEQLERPPCVPNVNLIGAVIIYCDPESYPDMMPVAEKWRVAVGLHPKKVGDITSKQLDRLKQLIQNNRVSAVGEVGLDTSPGSCSVESQIHFLRDLVTWVKPYMPIILHIRSAQRHSSDLYKVALDILQDSCHRSQNFVLHCFTGNTTSAKKWLQIFPNTYFGFTHLVTQFDNTQLEALRFIPENRLLVETDSPYMPPSGIFCNSPMYIGEVAEKVAALRYTTLALLAECTTKNAKRLFYI